MIASVFAHCFAEAARGGDTAALVSLLADDVVLRGDGGGKALATKKPVVGNVPVAHYVIAVTQTLPLEAIPKETEFNGAPGLVAVRMVAPWLRS